MVVDEDKAPGIVAAIISSKGVIASCAAGVRKVGRATLMTHRAGVEDCFTYDQQLTKEKRLGLLKEKLSGRPVHKQGEFNYSNFGLCGCRVYGREGYRLAMGDLDDRTPVSSLGNDIRRIWFSRYPQSNRSTVGSSKIRQRMAIFSTRLF